jgi:antitoxin MazE
MKSKLIRIGNSKGVRIPKSMLEDAGLTDEIEILQQEDEILIRPIRVHRVGWDDAFKRMALQGDDSLTEFADFEIKSDWDETDWTW